ncbi:uncharacterized protein PODANS_5_7920 [Podospora anserina S mat+]|uniref:Conserved oligomeric Golgi complex subunit 5 n=1 Tax=Podospora anserina (strain S / ATCC MYA-4624 / DSM 980 / FGSC 10383) TaxID=515849 RepID=B2AKI6_PODAN|nr:uncharacterized protein PODANS_5_7920 [Podospora anserina S mat+]CAP64507.1 unnamed protein product [Podospora anserina S mat+]CDP29904.1 Putative protein of unknown function [Podospora anserina S mat+]
MSNPNDPSNTDEPSYINYEAFLSPTFSPSAFANTLVLSTNNPTELPLDLSTPLRRVLFDIQEIDSHIDSLTTRSSIPLLSHTKSQTDASVKIVSEVDAQLKALNESYKQLEKQVIQKHSEAEQVKLVAARLWETLRLGRAVGRALQLGRQLEVQNGELTGSATASVTTSAASLKSRERQQDHRALVRCTHTLLQLRELFASVGTPGGEGYGLEKVLVVRTLREQIVAPVEKNVRETAERIAREFSVGSASGSATFAQSEEIKGRTVSALTALYLLTQGPTRPNEKWAPTLMLQALEGYLRSALQSSIAGLSRALANLDSLSRTLAEVGARCQNVVALEAVLEGTKVPVHPMLQGKQPVQGGNMLQPLLAYLETGSLASYFWRTMASSMAPRVQEIVAKGNTTAARTLRANRQSVGEAIRECVIKGSQLPSVVAAAAAKGKGKTGDEEAASKQWEREVAVMVGSVVNNLGR